MQHVNNEQLRYMRHALALAKRGLGNTFPNPAVGAVIVKDGAIVGTGWTARGGRPHAETIAIEQAGALAKGATIYVTLEPCSHEGRTPPCTGAIIRAGIKHVVAACTDPNPKVSGQGFAQLRAAGIEVTEGVCEQEAQAVNEGFFSVIKRGRPFVTLKLATSLDGKIATSSGESKWITCEDSRRYVHHLRKINDAVMTGIGTIRADNPAFTCRLQGCSQDSPIRVIADTNLHIAADAAALPAWIMTAEGGSGKAEALTRNGARIFTVPRAQNGLSLPAILDQLAKQGITRLMVESGNKLGSALLNEGLVDRIYWFRAPLVIGDKGLSALSGKEGALAALTRYRLQESRPIGSDVLEIYELSI
ncbi:MAG TPA: bifunctional diaminohydroxyphosphoribosylaminopyrimidine deaminase/5-amino-6-(5-phosphoribosylamino)uracil reductase RibD [Rickettsiales bacterium]|nr:bifunctional diaminohydroxyphosphoribosylaminopyrimidine deaminase/5-amino-6-(5-phosphoribosylamino)uracil reductase RibD [Rickettsiales bacterium]